MRVYTYRVKYIKVGNLLLREKLPARFLGQKRRHGYGFMLRSNDQVKLRKAMIILCGMAAVCAVLRLASIRY